jgi:hypothetical protein
VRRLKVPEERIAITITKTASAIQKITHQRVSMWELIGPAGSIALCCG